jgi:hypothetical protein
MLVVAAPAQLVQNGGFEEIDDPATPNIFTDWTLSGNGDFFFVTGDAHSGSRAASFGAVGSQTFLAQTIITTIPGETYTLDFWLSNLRNGDELNPNLFTGSWGGIQFATLSNVPAFGYTKFSYELTASSSSTLLQFGFQNKFSEWHFDDVSVTETSRGVPDSASTVLLLGTALAGLGVFQRKRRVAR